MLAGQRVTVLTPIRAGTDPGGDPVWQTVEEDVDDVLVQDGAQSNASDSTRPYGVAVDRVAHMPRSWPHRSLRGCRMRIDGVEYTVLGDPVAYDGGITPTRWDLTVDLHDERG